jgi:hypothetical protein
MVQVGLLYSVQVKANPAHGMCNLCHSCTAAHSLMMQSALQSAVVLKTPLYTTIIFSQDLFQIAYMRKGKYFIINVVC